MGLLLLFRGGGAAPPGSPPPPPFTPPPLTHGVALATYTTEVAWSDYASGLITFDFSTFDGADVFAASTFDQSFDGPLDDISADVLSITITRGRASDLGREEEGRMTIRLLDPYGKYNRQNPTSPLLGQLLPLRAVRFRANFGGIDYGRFSGWIRRITYEPNGRRGEAQIECSDLLLRFARDAAQVPTTGQTTTGAAIGKLLDSIGYTTPTLRLLGTGDDIPDFQTDGEAKSIEYLAALLDAEGGRFFQTGAGVATYHDRHYRDTTAYVGIIENEMAALGTGTDLDSIVNRWSVTRLPDGIAQNASDGVSITRYGEIPSEVSTPYLMTDAAAAGLAAFRVGKTADPAANLWSLKIDNRTVELLGQILARELDDLILVSEQAGLTYGRFFIERIQEEIDVMGGKHSVNYTLSEGANTSGIVFDTSTFDGPDVFVY